MPKGKRVIQRGPSALPSAGHRRDEELRRRADDLGEAAEDLSADREHYSVNPKAFQKDRELQHLLDTYNELEVSNADPAYVYCWVQHGSHGLFVKLKLAEKWEVVQGDMQESVELKGLGADTTRKLGDVILMRIRKDFFKEILRRRKAAAERRMQTIDANLIALGEKYEHLGVKVATPDGGNIDPRTLELMDKRAKALSTSRSMQDKWIREGRMPGMPAPGVETE